MRDTSRSSIVGIVLLCVLPCDAWAGSSLSAPPDPENQKITDYPKPGDPRFAPMLQSIEDRTAKAKLALTTCVHDFVDRNAVPDSDAEALSKQACLACIKEHHALSDANNDFFRFNDGWNPAYTGDNNRDRLPFQPSVCAEGLIYSLSAIKEKQKKEEADLEPILQDRMKMKLRAAIDCDEKYSKLFALSTSESPENIATAAFAKCEPLFADAAEVRINPIYKDGARAERVSDILEAFRDEALKRTIAIVIESRARQKLAPPDATGGVSKPEKGDTGI